VTAPAPGRPAPAPKSGASTRIGLSRNDAEGRHNNRSSPCDNDGRNVEGIDPDAPERSRASDDKATFTFGGEPKPVKVPDVLAADLAKSGEE
jgi:hypothetical protein